jgi:hypothetical protein
MSHRIPLVKQLPIDWRESGYDALFCAVGYEERARHIPGILREKPIKAYAIGFDVQKEMEYANNRRYFEEQGFSVSAVRDDDLAGVIKAALEGITTHAVEEPVKVLIDISSLSRFRLATYIVTLVRHLRDRTLIVDFVYTLAAYDPPVTSLAPNSHVGPALRSNFTGGWDEPDRAVSAIVGLGYEPDKALGAVEYLEAADVWTFTPRSEVEEYTHALMVANESLLEDVPTGHQFTYLVHDPLDCFLTLEAIVSGVMQTRNAVLLPFGPKLFALCCLLVGCIHPVAIWRVSAQGAEPPVNRRSSNRVYGLRAEFRETLG